MIDPRSLPAAPGARSHRVVWHTAGIVLAALAGWLVFRAYRDPAFLIDLSNLRLC